MWHRTSCRQGRLVCDTPALAVALKVLKFGQVPLLREDELAALLYGGIQISRVGMEAKVLVQRTPVLMGIVLLAVLADGERLGGSVSVGSVDVDLHLVNGV